MQNKEEIYCLDLTFTDELFENEQKDFHSHLVLRDNEIELQILFDPKIRFGYIFENWVNLIGDSNKIGKHIKVNSKFSNQNILKIDFEESEIKTFTIGGNRREGNKEYISINLSTIKIYWKPNNELINTSLFYLNKAGFNFVKSYYPAISFNNDKFEINRYNGKEGFYSHKSIEFRPEFDWITTQNNIDNNKVIIIKKPLIKINHLEEISEKEVLDYANDICKISSFFLHLNVDYISAKIYLKDFTLSIIKVKDKEFEQKPLGLISFNLNGKISDFFQSELLTSYNENRDKLNKAIENFTQSRLVDGNSKFLLRYNIIDICMKGITQENEKYTCILSEEEKKLKYINALEIIKQTVDEKDWKSFETKWETVKLKMEYKPMKSHLEDFLTQQNISINEFPITLSRLKKIRDKITHGSVNSIKEKQLDIANILIYRINVVLILNMLGINEWKINFK
ncbi:MULTISPECIES: hypothetical protein [Polaribacter]|uniref:ApeA N-terminal domain-containing protein n=2 Tax=Polaribacter sejongensis TaxID=985043 RepID=A0AAJ1QU56_9FLAO|nr:MULTISPECIES: hypothetical protein [Polaribacter]MDN3618231.1 hypothetical protein [Polaribacter undariae]UWD30781.1 hypothetical protein NQP51_11595 [Polaribacter undariae]